MRKPDFFIVGAPKCGTTAMYTYLRQHPEVFMSRLKEPHFFGSDHHRINHTPFTMEQYLSFFADAREQKRVGEASTSYLHSRRAAVEIKAFSPSASIIIMLRNPVDVMHAYHGTNLYGGFEFIADFPDALDAEHNRKCGGCWPDRAGILECLFYREVVEFSEQVRRYLNVFGRERVHVIIYDDFRDDTAGAFQATLRFLGVGTGFRPTFERIRPDGRIRSVGLQNVLLSPPRAVRRLSHAIAPERLRRALVGGVRGLNSRGGPRAPMVPELRKRLLAELAPEVERLGALLGRDLSLWSKE